MVVRLESLEFHQVQCSIQDTGSGIAEKDLDELFKDYAHLNMEQHHRIVRGTGLGLLISKEIIAAHKGKIGAQSIPGTGSTFYFTLPQAGGMQPERKLK